MSRVLVVGDLHLPAEHEDYLSFCKAIKKKYKTDAVVFIGDVVDHHAISFHHRHPEEDAAVAEYHRAMKGLKDWKKAFPEALVCIGNHDERVQRVAASAGIPPMYLKEYKEIYDTPQWCWKFEHTVDEVAYVHGTGASSGTTPAFNSAKARLQSTVSGHIHSAAAICWTEGPNNKRIFGFNVPCGVNKDHKMMQYGKNFLKKPINGVGVVIDGHPYMEIMS
jgi:predicted phosphodiesterase|tara:strand:- start:237 stop:899 length:663 start_codon:yes stop_codon:yes gene_type:complete